MNLNENSSTKRDTPARQAQQASDRVLERIKNINWELEALYSELRLAGPEAAVAKQFFGENAAAIQVLGHFKTALDRLRRTVWACLEDGDASPKAQEREQAMRLQRVTEVMRKLSPQPDIPAVTQSGSFFERLNLVIDNYIETRPLRSTPPKSGKA
ncbi:MAG: hypothetical protein ACHP79_03995 [Terriglobales bacterium]